MAAKPGAETPTMTGAAGGAGETRRVTSTASLWVSLGASPIMPRMVRPSAPFSK